MNELLKYCRLFSTAHARTVTVPNLRFANVHPKLAFDQSLNIILRDDYVAKNSGLQKVYLTDQVSRTWP